MSTTLEITFLSLAAFVYVLICRQILVIGLKVYHETENLPGFLWFCIIIFLAFLWPIILLCYILLTSLRAPDTLSQPKYLLLLNYLILTFFSQNPPEDAAKS